MKKAVVGVAGILMVILITGDGCTGQAQRNTTATQFSSLTEGVETAVGELRQVFGNDSIPSVASFIRQLDSIASALKHTESDSIALEKILTRVYSHWDVSFDKNQDDLFGMLPHTTVSNKRGSCMGVSILLLMLAEKADIPLHGVVIPGHFFVRYQDERVRRNIEPNRAGFQHPDSYYRTRYGIEDSSWYTMENLTAGQSLGVFFYNIGNFCRQSERLTLAERFYRRSVESFPRFAPAWGNLAILYLRTDRPKHARKAFQTAYDCFPRLENLLFNFATFELRMGNARKAAKLYSRALQNGQRTPQLLTGLASALERLGKNDSAAAVLRSAFQAESLDRNSAQ